MNWRRGLFRLWLLASVLWVGGCLWLLDYSCFFGAYPWCNWWVVRPLLSSTYAEVLAKTFGPPVILFLIGYALLWIGRGFRSRA
jgi:hypothetical protein